MTTYLLDVNLLLALTDPRHIHYDVAHRWFTDVGGRSWASCPLTENGFVRIASHPRYPNRPGNVGPVLAILQQFCSAAEHRFWAEDVSIRGLLSPDTLVTHAQITDVFLLGVAVRHGGKLATLDQNLPAAAIQGGPEALERISL